MAIDAKTTVLSPDICPLKADKGIQFCEACDDCDAPMVISDDELSHQGSPGVYLGAGVRALVDQLSLVIISQDFMEEVGDIVRDDKYIMGIPLGSSGSCLGCILPLTYQSIYPECLPRHSGALPECSISSGGALKHSRHSRVFCHQKHSQPLQTLQRIPGTGRCIFHLNPFSNPSPFV